ncbi:hypothetical protein [Richelia sinica]|nr:hypothetical protein [Richelia sinica]
MSGLTQLTQRSHLLTPNKRSPLIMYQSAMATPVPGITLLNR